MGKKEPNHSLHSKIDREKDLSIRKQPKVTRKKFVKNRAFDPDDFDSFEESLEYSNFDDEDDDFEDSDDEDDYEEEDKENY